MCIDSIPQGYKRCTKCGEVKAVEEFYKHKAYKDGLRSQCKACQVLESHQWDQANPEKAREKVHRYQRANPEKERERSRQRSQRRRVRKNGVIHAVPANIDGILFDVQNGYCMYCQCELLNGYHVDHIVPLALADQLGDKYPGHVPTNLALTCPKCNKSKSDTLLEDWLAWKYQDQMDEILHRVEQHIEIMREWE